MKLIFKLETADGTPADPPKSLSRQVIEPRTLKGAPRGALLATGLATSYQSSGHPSRLTGNFSGGIAGSPTELVFPSTSISK